MTTICIMAIYAFALAVFCLRAIWNAAPRKED